MRKEKVNFGSQFEVTVHHAESELEVKMVIVSVYLVLGSSEDTREWLRGACGPLHKGALVVDLCITVTVEPLGPLLSHPYLRIGRLSTF